MRAATRSMGNHYEHIELSLLEQAEVKEKDEQRFHGPGWAVVTN
jgi:hypothetical protein